MENIFASLLEKRGWKLRGKSESGKCVEKFEKNKISETIFKLFCSDPFYRVLSMVLFTRSLKSIKDIVSEITDFNLKYTLKESLIKKFVCKNCKFEYRFPKWDSTKINICENCGRKNLYVEEYWELKNIIDLVRSSITYYLKNLEKRSIIGCSFETFCPFCLTGSSFEDEKEINITKLTCEKCKRMMELSWAFSVPENISIIWESGFWLEWYVKKLLKTSLGKNIKQGIILQKRNSKIKKEVDCIFLYRNKIISIECRVKKPNTTYKEQGDFSNLFEFSDVAVLVTTTKISENLIEKFKNDNKNCKKVFVNGYEIEDLPNIIERCVK